VDGVADGAEDLLSDGAAIPENGPEDTAIDGVICGETSSGGGEAPTTSVPQGPGDTGNLDENLLAGEGGGSADCVVAGAAAEDAGQVWPDSAEGMDQLLGQEGDRIPDGPNTPGRNKVTWQPNGNTKITSEQHPYDEGAPDWHTGPHWHLDTPGAPHVRYMPGDPIPGY
jgi:hypothetical protein